MMTVSVRELRNNTASVVASVTAGEPVTLTSNGKPVARIEPVDPYLKPYMTWDEFVAMPKMDPGFLDELLAMRAEDTGCDADPWAHHDHVD
jgi:prevent-host-death family protein